jgi:ATP-binding cassette, subfamily F, member 3
MFQLHNITLRRGEKTLLKESSVRVDSGNRIGLIGRNGAGKTSLIALLTGNLSQEEGDVLIPKIQSIAHLSQALPDRDQIAFAYVREGDQQWLALHQKIIKAEETNDGMALATLYSDMETIDGYGIDLRTTLVLQGLGFQKEEMQQPIASFSGGWQMRLQLARVLMSQADLLLLDEPTNHLDLETIIWLEQWLLSYKGTTVIISHDREFLDHVTQHIISISNQRLKRYKGNYTSYAKQMHEALILQEKQNEKTIKKQKHLQKFVDRFKAKASKAKQAQSRVKAIEKLSLSQDLQRESDVSFAFLASEKQPEGDLIQIDAALGYGETIIVNAYKLTVNKGDRIGVIGTNGSGKSTLLKSIAQDIPTLKGKINLNNKVNIGYFSQQQLDQLRPDDTPLAHLLFLDRSLTQGQVRQYLGGFGFKNDDVFRRVGSFSGGEKARLALALLIWKRPNILVLDEPTNHLDMQVREALMFALQSFEGAVILVSHDRYFIDCCVSELWHVHEGKVIPYSGNLSDYAESQKAQDAILKKKKNQKKNKKKTSNNSSILKQLEHTIEQQQKELMDLETKANNPLLYEPDQIDTLSQLHNTQKKLRDKLEENEEKWLKLHAEQDK